MDRIIDVERTAQYMKKCQELYHNNRELVENLIVQIAFHAFGFKKNMRITVMCVSALFTLLEDNLKEALQQFSPKKKEERPEIPFTTDIRFSYKLSTNIVLPSSYQ
jgi:hypothetical protein